MDLGRLGINIDPGEMMLNSTNKERKHNWLPKNEVMVFRDYEEKKKKRQNNVLIQEKG